MVNYIDGYVFPIPRSRVAAYRRLAEAVAQIWLEHGALGYREFVNDDSNVDGTRSFSDLASASEEEVVIFGWVEFDSKAARDAANESVAADPRMSEILGASNTGFDAARMAFSGFQPLVSESIH